MDLKWERLSSGEQIAAGSALALFVCMFFSWFNFGFDTTNAWESLHFISPILTVAIVITLGIAFMRATGKSLGDLPTGSMIFVLGCLATVLVLYRLVDPVSLPGAEGFEPTGDVQAGLFLALLAAAGIAAGGYVATGGTALNQLKTLIPSGNPAPPPPAPTASPAPSPVSPVAPPPPTASPTPPPAPAPPATAGKSFCEECGAAIDSGDRFCSECGKEQGTTAG